MRKLILVILPLLCIVGCKQVDRTEILLTKVDSLQIKNDSLTKVLTQERHETNYWYDAEYDGKALIENGITNPTEFIEKELRERTELIPSKAVLGGTMHFGNIQLLSREWLIADFNDGHVQGRAIYRYKLNEKGQLKFEILNAIEPE